MYYPFQPTGKDNPSGGESVAIRLPQTNDRPGGSVQRLPGRDPGSANLSSAGLFRGKGVPGADPARRNRLSHHGKDRHADQPADRRRSDSSADHRDDPRGKKAAQRGIRTRR